MLTLKEVVDKVCQVESGEKAVRYLLKETDFLKAPASSKYHLACEGGLVKHSLNVIENILRHTKMFNIQWERPESPYIIGLFHDLCKANFYKVSYRNAKNEEGAWVKVPFYEIDDQDPLGHGEKSTVLLQRYMPLTEQEMYCIYFHMGAFGDPNYVKAYSNACKKHPEIVIVALSDQLAGIKEDLQEAHLDLSLYGGIFEDDGSKQEDILGT